MDHKGFLSRVLTFGAAAAAALAGLRCDSILPAKFQDKQYTIADADASACSSLSRANDSSFVIQARDLAALVDSATRATSSDNQIILARFDALADSLPPLRRDSLMLVTYPAGQKVTYAALRVLPGQSAAMTIYVSLRFTQANINDRVTVDLVKRDTSLVAAQADMAGETVSGCTQIVVVNDNPTIVPTIRARLRLQAAEGVYLVRFTLSRAEAVGPFKLAIFSH